MMVTAVMVMAADRFGQIPDIRELSILRGALEIGRELVQLIGRGRVPIRLGGLSGGLQIGGDLLRYLLVLRRIRLLKLLKSVHDLEEGRKLAHVLLLQR